MNSVYDQCSYGGGHCRCYHRFVGSEAAAAGVPTRAGQYRRYQAVIRHGRAEAREQTVDYVQIAAIGLGKVFPPKVIGNWKFFSEEEKLDRIKAYINYLSQALGVNINSIVIEDLPEGLYGAYDDSKQNIELNAKEVFTPEDPLELINTLTHEMRHGVQYNAIRHPELFDFSQEIIDSWAYNNAHYITGEEDLQAYWEQPIEKDARKFAADVMALVGLKSADPD